MKIIVTGSNGQLGKEIIRQTIPYSDLVIIPIDIDSLDITNYDAVKSLFLETTPDVVINCAAYTNVDGCETNEATAFCANALGARNLSVAAAEQNARIVQISTDYVFDGEGNAPKREYDVINPQSVYGKSKALGEHLVKETNQRHFILRTAWLYGDGNNFVKTILKLASQQDKLTIVNDQFGSPTSTVDLTNCILELIKTDYYGTYHATSEGFCTWYDFAKKILELKGISNVTVLPMTTEELNRPAKRPKYSVMENFMLSISGINSFRQWEDPLSEYIKNI